MFRHVSNNGALQGFSLMAANHCVQAGGLFLLFGDEWGRF